MPLPNYGLLTGRLVDHSPQYGGNPHYQLFVQANGIRYRVAVNLESTVDAADVAPELQYQIIPDLRQVPGAGAKALVSHVRNQSSFMPKRAQPTLPTLDFVRGGVVDMAKFTTIPRGTNPENNAFYKALVAAADRAKGDAKAFVAVFGTGFSGGRGGGLHASAGFDGVDNVHMNQGNFRLIDNSPNHFFRENGPDQDGAVLFFHADNTVQGLFAKFQSQDNATDDYGNPVHTGVAELDAVPAAVRARVAPPNRFAHLRTAAAPQRGRRGPRPTGPAPTNGAPGGFVFGGATPGGDPNRPFVPDDDAAVRNSPFVENFAKYGVPEPVPGPRGGKYPVLKLADVLGAPAVQAVQQAGQIVFHAVGDTGSAVAPSLPHEDAVAALMAGDCKAADAKERPAFFFHLGDVVYFYGEQQFYYEQFYKPYEDYSGPIFAIPGNHDGITYNKDMVSLDAFQKAFCDDRPRHWEGAAGIPRTSMIQPGVYFTLDAPFVSIIGLYSNCSETYGYLDDQQKLFLYSELKRLKPLRDGKQLAAILVAVHHPPLSFNPQKPSSAQMRNDMDKACQEADCWPDAVLSGHAHLYQRMTRNLPVGGKNWQVPYVVSGSGGYGMNPRQEIDKAGVKLLDEQDKDFRLHRFLPNYGYLRLTVRPKNGATPPTLRIEFHSPDVNVGHPSADACVLDLSTHQYRY